ncbi:MAG: prephenate dehydratase, partial [Acidimicrobiia bacterium]|nr:prephenate dehydratase [Acidimicrobiia bacterium]MYA38636.1 prephenate dehydratase [Acidimicrobiia bacterium]MYH04879.1 prephenate dehydratase [Acidimicrobiia bacterium]
MRRLPDVVMVAANSTAAAARELAARGDLDTVVIAPQ